MAHLGKAIAMAEKEASGAAEEDRSDLTGSGHRGTGTRPVANVKSTFIDLTATP